MYKIVKQEQNELQVNTNEDQAQWKHHQTVLFWEHQTVIMGIMNKRVKVRANFFVRARTSKT